LKLRNLILLFFAVASVQGVILFRTDDPLANTAAPTGADAKSGWQYEGGWGSFLGTAFAPHFFLSAAHIGKADDYFIFQSVAYHIVAPIYDPSSDLVVWEVREELPSFAPLYSRTDEVGQRIMVFGRGTQRGEPVILNDTLKGWLWGPGDSVERWGENIVSGIYTYNANNQLLMANFDANGLPNECHLSSGDSGGAAFLNDGGVWKLAGINYAVDGPFYNDSLGTGAFYAALFDVSGFYEKDGNNFVPVTGPSALYPTRISLKLPWIAATIARGIAGYENNLLTLTYTQLDLPTSDLVYTVQQSTDLAAWTPASATEETLSVNGSTKSVKAKVDVGTKTALFIRLQPSRP